MIKRESYVKKLKFKKPTKIAIKKWIINIAKANLKIFTFTLCFKKEKNIIKCETTDPAFYLGLIPGNRWVDFIFSKETF